MIMYLKTYSRYIEDIGKRIKMFHYKKSQSKTRKRGEQKIQNRKHLSHESRKYRETE